MRAKRRGALPVKRNKVEKGVEVLETLPKKKETQVTNDVSNEELKKRLIMLKQLNSIKEEKKLLEKREQKLKEQLREFVVAHGVKDVKGSFNLKLGDFVVSNQNRSSVKLNQDKALEKFTELGLLDDVSETKIIVRDDLVEQAITQGKVSQDILDEIMDVKSSYAFVVSEYKEEEGAEDATK